MDDDTGFLFDMPSVAHLKISAAFDDGLSLYRMGPWPF
jgi:hypothetical protein